MDRKVKRPRLTSSQSKLLSIIYNQNSKPGIEIRTKIASEFKIPTRTVQIWFQNRRAKEKRHKTQTKKKEQKEELQEKTVPFLNSLVTSYEDYFDIFVDENY